MSCVDFFLGGGYNKHTAWLTSLVITIKCAHLVKRLLLHTGISVINHLRERKTKRGGNEIVFVKSELHQSSSCGLSVVKSS